MDANFRIAIEPLWDEIDRVRDEVETFLGGRGIDRDSTDAVTMVTCELTENAVKYGSFGPGDEIVVALRHRERSLLVEVRSPVAPEEEESLFRLDEMIQWIRGHQDPFEAYLDRLEEVSMLDLHSKESGLGLVRIAYEGQAILDFYVNETHTLAVSALHEL